MLKKHCFSVSEVAEFTGIDQKRVKAILEQKQKRKFGANDKILINRDQIEEILNIELSKKEKKALDATIDKIFKEYSKTLELLGAE